jgi:diguanylate cyclase (GGDEF)-like protein/PAS domain S-box-containing protein
MSELAHSLPTFCFAKEAQSRCLTLHKVCACASADAQHHCQAADAGPLQEAALHTLSILDNMLDGVLTINKRGHIESVNKAAVKLFGYTAEELLGHSVGMLLPEPYSGDHDQQMQLFKTTGSNYLVGTPREILGRRKDGSLFPISLSVSKIARPGRPTFVGVIRDITQRRQQEEEIQRLAFYDPLTQLPNRRLLLDRLRQALMTSARSGQRGALMFLDLDHFKLLNDTLGHDLGDALLKQVATRLKTCVREGDTVARLGGDEFVVLLEGLSPNITDSAADAEAVANKILAALSQPYALLEQDMRRGLARQEFMLLYQFQVDVQGVPIGAEALLRWNHSTRGLVPPAQFIALAEQTSVGQLLGQWVLDAACNQLVLWAQQQATAAWTLAINVGPSQFDDESFVTQIATALYKTGANPQRLKLELTESMLMNDSPETRARMHAIKALGVGFSLDDFGTGYSSLLHLQRLPLDQLKIDKSFVHDLLTKPGDASVARSVVALGHSLGLTVIAEGVETAEQRNMLAELGCDAFQGYFFGHPAPACELIHL